MSLWPQFPQVEAKFGTEGTVSATSALKGNLLPAAWPGIQSEAANPWKTPQTSTRPTLSCRTMAPLQVNVFHCEMPVSRRSRSQGRCWTFLLSQTGTFGILSTPKMELKVSRAVLYPARATHPSSIPLHPAPPTLLRSIRDSINPTAPHLSAPGAPSGISLSAGLPEGFGSSCPHPSHTHPELPNLSAPNTSFNSIF